MEEEIEYLEEDAEIVQQLLNIQHTAPSLQNDPTSTTDEDVDETIASLVNKRTSTNSKKRKLKTEDEDSDYDPTEDLLAIKKAPSKKYLKTSNESTQKDPKKALKTGVHSKKHDEKSQLDKEYEERKKFQIRIPDFEDPLCLPVKAIINDFNDQKRLQTWNNMCLQQYQRIDMIIPNSKHPRIVGSTKTMTFKNVKNLNIGKVETTVIFRTVTRNELGVKKIDQCSGSLPRYREKRLLNFNLAQALPRPIRNRHEALLNKETQDNEELLVVYKPRDCISAVYQLVDEERDNAPPRRVLDEISAVKICAPCYQVSWRGNADGGTQTMQCVICKRTFISVYNLLSHLKTHHKSPEVRSNQVHLSHSLSKVVGYHYRCRICQAKCNSIKLLKTHVGQHKGDEVFQCEVGNHMAS